MSAILFACIILLAFVWTCQVSILDAVFLITCLIVVDWDNDEELDSFVFATKSNIAFIVLDILDFKY